MYDNSQLTLEDNIDFLNRSFTRAFNKAAKRNNWRLITTRNDNNPLYTYQVDFMYLINELEMGPYYLSIKLISYTKDLIAKLETEGT